MKTVELSYNPYKMQTTMLIDGVDVCQSRSYGRFKDFIENEIPLQTWIEPIGYLNWAGFVNEISDTETNDEVTVVFSGRVIDLNDLKRAIADQNDERSAETRVVYHFKHKRVLDDQVLSKNIEEVVSQIKSDRFRELVQQRTTENLTKRYENLDENYRLAKENVFYIVLAGVYSSGKSTLLNALIRHNILPYSSKTCTSKNCRIRHDGSLGSKVSLTCFDDDDNPVIKKRVFDSDSECASAFLEICPVKSTGITDKYPNVTMMELGVDLSHLYPDSVNRDQFTIVLIDTPGMDSAQSSENGTNKHAEIALKAISMDSKPMIILCAGADYYDNKSIGEFMREIISQSKEDSSGFNDRFLFLMNKSDAITYKQDETAEGAKMAFAEYLTDSSRWNIKGDETDLKQLAEDASHFVPRVFMTAGRIAFAIQQRAFDFTDEELEDKDKYDLLDKYESFEKKICGRRKFVDYYLSRYCDIPNYRKDELETVFQTALEDDDNILATQIQSGIMSVEIAIRDYIERYAYPIKVRGLLKSFEDILEDVNGFTNGVLADLKKTEKELGERSSERKEASERKTGVEEKIAALEKAKGKIEKELKALDAIKFDSSSLRRAMGEFRADIEADREIAFIRANPKVSTGQKSHAEVEAEINGRISRIKTLFDGTLKKTNSKLNEIKSIHDKQVLEVIGFLKAAVVELENSGVFQKGDFKFTDSVLWKMSFDKIDSDKFASEMMEKVVDRTTKSDRVYNYKKDEWRSSWNPFKKLGSLFMSDYKDITVNVDGFYDTTVLKTRIDDYLFNLQTESNKMETNFNGILENSKREVRDLTQRLLRELRSFLTDIQVQENRIKELSKSIEKLTAERKAQEETCEWLNSLEMKIKGD